MSDDSQPGGTPAGGRRRADDRAEDLPPARVPGPETDRSTTLPQGTRADRRHEGLLASGEDPLIRRPPARPAGGPPPGAGRRRTDADPMAAPGRPPATGERRRAPAPQPPAVAAPAARAPERPGPAVPRPAPSPAVSGPMTAAAPMTPAAPMTAAAPLAVRVQPPAARRDDVATSAADRPAGPDAAPATTGMPSWAAEPGPATPAPHDMTQRVSLAAPAESPWGSPAAPLAAAVEAPRPAPARPVRSGPASAPPPARPAAGRTAPEQTDPEPVDEPEAPRRNRAEIPVGGRAAARLERVAAEAARKKSGGRRPGPTARPEAAAPPSGPGRDADPDAEPRRLPRRLVQGLVAFVVVAVGVLGFWSFTSPEAKETSAETPVTSAPVTTPAAVPPVEDTVDPTAEVTPPAPVGPVRAPITVLNSTKITGLAADIGDQFTAGGWEVAGTDASPVTDVATTTVYFTEGDTVQQQAATQLVEQFPDVTGPVARYFEVPGQPTPGIVVVATGNWRP